MIRKLGAGAAMAAVLAMVAGVGEASAQTAEAACKAGVLTGTPLPWRFDIVRHVAGPSEVMKLQPTNRGDFDAIICNISSKPNNLGNYGVDYAYGGSASIPISGGACHGLTELSGMELQVKAAGDWEACVWVRYRDRNRYRD